MEYGERESAVDLAIGEIKKSLRDFPKQVKNGKNWKEKKYREKKKEIIENVRKLKSRGSNIQLPWGRVK